MINVITQSAAGVLFLPVLMKLSRPEFAHSRHGLDISQSSRHLADIAKLGLILPLALCGD